MLFGISESSLNSCLSSRGTPRDQLISPVDAGSTSYVSPSSLEEVSGHVITTYKSCRLPVLKLHLRLLFF